MGKWAWDIFALVCGQPAFHTWAPGGVLLPLCQRCTGLYVGAALALTLHLAFRIRPGVRFLQVHGLFLLLMVPLGYHWVAQGAVVRSVSGLLFGAGLVAFLWLFPGPHVGRLRWLAPGPAAVYASVVLAGAASVPALGLWGGVPGAHLLVMLATCGLAGLTALALANLAIVAVRLVTMLAPRGRLGP